MMMMSKNVLAFVLVAVLGTLGTACASGETVTDSDDTTEGQSSAVREAADDDSSDPTVEEDEANVAVSRVLRADTQLKTAPIPQPWNAK